MSSLSIIVASSGRPTLAHTLVSTRGQLRDGDEILVSIQSDCPWGHAARNQLMRCARGDALLFIDDDDVHTPDALAVVRAAVETEPDRIHIFRMMYSDGRTLWEGQEVRSGNVSTQMVVIPFFLARVSFGSRYEGDFDFIDAACRIAGPPAWHEEIIALVRPGQPAPDNHEEDHEEGGEPE